MVDLFKHIRKLWNKQYVCAVKSAKLRIILVYNIVTTIVLALLYPILPVLMGYGPGFKEAALAVGVSYEIQFISAIILYILIGTIILSYYLGDIDKLQYKDLSITEVKRLREKYINIPYTLFIGQILLSYFPLISVIAVTNLIADCPKHFAFKILSIFLSFFSLAAIITHIFSRDIFRSILNNTAFDGDLAGKRVSVKSKIFILMIPIITTSIIITAVFSYSRLIEEKGNIAYEIVKLKVSEIMASRDQFDSSDKALEKLTNIRINNLKTVAYAISPSGGFFSPDGYKPSGMLMQYMKNPIDNERVYGDSMEVQGISFRARVNNENWTFGIVYEVTSEKTVDYFFIVFAALMVINILVLFYISKSLSKDITMVANNLNDIAAGKGEEERKLIPVNSNDEIGDLIAAFNKIQNKEINYDNMKNEFFANISHEFRTPISIILSSIQLLDMYSKTANQSGSKKVTNVMRQNCYRLIRLVNNLIDTTKISASFYEVNMKSCNIINIVEEITLSVANYLKEKSISLLFDTDVEEKITACDPDMIERIIMNLLSNAVKFTGEGGKIFVNIKDNGDGVEISVKDTGIGISPDQLEEIFYRFKQVDKSLTRKREGSGIGLSLVKSLVEMHGGKIKAFSELGKGTEFIVFLPVRQIEENPSANDTDKNIYADKVHMSIEKISIEFSDIYNS